jgi:hypothetical protein
VESAVTAPTFHGVTMTPGGPVLAWAWPDGTVRLATLVWRDARRDGDTITPARYEAVPHATVDPDTLWPETMPVPNIQNGPF